MKTKNGQKNMMQEVKKIYKNAINRENAKNKNAKHKQTNEETEEDKRIIQLVSKLGGLEEDKK